MHEWPQKRATPDALIGVMRRVRLGTMGTTMMSGLGRLVIPARSVGGLLLAVTLTACSTAPSPTPPLAAFGWALYNRTEATVGIGPALGLAQCTSARFAPGPAAPGATLLPSTIPLAVQVTVPPGYTGIVSVVVASDGTHVTIGEIDPGHLPACGGFPKQ